MSYKKKLTKFIDVMNNEYSDNTVLRDFREVSQFTDQTDISTFQQIGRRTSLPKKFFSQEDHYNNSALARDFARSITQGESVYIAESCIDSAGSSVKLVENNRMPEFDVLVSAQRQLPDPDHLFVPIYKEYYDRVNDWIVQRGSFKGDYETINLGKSQLKVHWIPTNSEIKEMVVVDSGYLPIVQKYGGQSETPTGVEPINKYSDISKNRKVICDIGRDENPEKFDFVCRTVLSELSPDEYSAFVIRLSDSVSLTT